MSAQRPHASRKSRDSAGAGEPVPSDSPQLSFGFLPEPGGEPPVAEPTASPDCPDCPGPVSDSPDRRSRARPARMASTTGPERRRASGTTSQRLTDDAVRSPAARPQGETCVEPGLLASAFGVDFAVTPGTTCVALDGAGQVVSGHLAVFAARSAGR